MPAIRRTLERLFGQEVSLVLSGVQFNNLKVVGFETDAVITVDGPTAPTPGIARVTAFTQIQSVDF